MSVTAHSSSRERSIHHDLYEESKHHKYALDRFGYSSDDISFAQPTVAANGPPQAYRTPSLTEQHSGSSSSLDSFLQDGMRSPVDLSPPMTPVALVSSHNNNSWDEPREPTMRRPLPAPSLASSKRSFTTSVVPPSSSIQLSKTLDSSVSEPVVATKMDSNILARIEKRHSTFQPVRTVVPEEDEKQVTMVGRPLGRHHTTGHALRAKKKQQPQITGISEEFAKELSARRRAFKRLSRRPPPPQSDEPEDERVLMGTRVDKHHRDYVLMYNMLTGIRIAVGRVSAKANRALTDEDFEAAHKLAFNVTGDELTPGAKYDFKFKDYAPWVFRHLREKFGIDPADYLVSLTSKYILSELGSPGKSGSFFYYSRDYRFIIKTIHHSEHKYLRTILKEYHNHVSNNPDTLLCRYYGLHRVKQPRGRKIHFVVMGNVFPPQKDIHETYDLKGSLIGRLLPEEEIKKNKNAVMKDLNFQKNGKKLQLGPTKRKLFINQLMRDVKLLVRLNIMDYSLLIGIHNMVLGNKENIRDSTLQLFQPDTKRAERRASVMRRRQSKAQAVRKAIAQTNPERLDSSQLPEDPFEERRNCVFYSDEGGFQSTDEQDRPTTTLYYMGIIDILTPYDAKKKSEHFFKSMTQDKHAISAVKPLEYGNRFMAFMAKTLEHNDDVPKEYQMGSSSKRW